MNKYYMYEKGDIMNEYNKTIMKYHEQLEQMYETIARIITDEKEKEIIRCLIQDLADKLIDNKERY